MAKVKGIADFLSSIVKYAKEHPILVDMVTDAMRKAMGQGQIPVLLAEDDIEFALRSWVFTTFLGNNEVNLSLLMEDDPRYTVQILSQIGTAYKEGLPDRQGLFQLIESLLSKAVKHPQFPVFVHNLVIEEAAKKRKRSAVSK